MPEVGVADLYRVLLRRGLHAGPLHVDRTGGVGFRIVECAAAIAGLAEKEQQCCAFLGFSVGIAGGHVTLEITAPADAKAILDEMFGAPA